MSGRGLRLLLAIPVVTGLIHPRPTTAAASPSPSALASTIRSRAPATAPSRALAAETRAAPSAAASPPSPGHARSGGRAAAAAIPPVWLRPAPPLPMLAGVGRVRLEVARSRVVVIEDVNLPKGEWRSGSLGVHVAFGVPGPPLAFDAHLIAAPPGSREAPLGEVGVRLPVQLAARREATTQPLLGKPQMAGVAVRMPESDLRHAFDASDWAVLRLRSVVPLPPADSTGARDVIVRLGTPGAEPLTLSRVEVVADPDARVARAEATLCGPDADARPLTVVVSERGPAVASVETIAPVAAVRHASDDLRVRWWSSP